jgi:hypothetical protein
MNKFIVNILHIFAILITTALILFFTSLSVQAAVIPDTYTNQNFWTSTHDQPVSFEQDVEGNFSGSTVTGKLFTQTNITNNLDIRLQRFAIDEAFFYISDRGIIIAPNNTTALSIYLERSVSV